MKVLVKYHNEFEPKVKLIHDEGVDSDKQLNDLQDLVEGWVEIVKVKNVAMIINEEGRVKKSHQPSTLTWNKESLFGNVVFAKMNHEGDLVTLTEEDEVRLSNLLLMKQDLKTNDLTGF